VCVCVLCVCVCVCVCVYVLCVRARACVLVSWKLDRCSTVETQSQRRGP